MKPLRKVLFGGLEPKIAAVLNRFQDAVEETLRDIQRDPSLDGTVIENVEIGTGNTLIAHKLGRRPQGWYIVRQRASALVWDNQDTNTSPAQFLALQASAAVFVDIKVY